jgi:hypothetical protein
VANLKVLRFPAVKRRPERIEVTALMKRLRSSIDKCRGRNISRAATLGCIEAVKAELLEEYLGE